MVDVAIYFTNIHFSRLLRSARNDKVSSCDEESEGVAEKTGARFSGEDFGARGTRNESVCSKFPARLPPP